MASRLSSLLVRDGLVGVKRMEKAFQRQVIYGGSLDTILLEMSLMQEERLTQYLALASGLPPASRVDCEMLEPTALDTIDRDTAERYRVVPLSIEGEALRILVCAPLEIAGLEDLADLLDRALQPLIAPEFRWHLVFSHAYGVEAPARFATLARTLEAEATPAPVGRGSSVIVDEGAGVGAVVTGQVTERTALADHTVRMAHAPDGARPPAMPDPGVSGPLEASDGTLPQLARKSTQLGVTPHRSRGTDPGAIIGPPRLPAGSSGPIEPITAPEGSGPTLKSTMLGRPSMDVRPAAPPPGKTHAHVVARPRQASRMPHLDRPSTPEIATSGRDGPLSIADARGLLATATNRDEIFLTLLRAARSRARYAGLLTVQGGAAIGRVALGVADLDTRAISTVLIPLDAASPFRAVVANHQPHIGKLVSGDPGIDAMILRMGGAMPPSALLLPIVIRERAVAIMIAHRVHSPLRIHHVTELLPLATATADAISRLIVTAKSGTERIQRESGAPDQEHEEVLTKKVIRPDQAKPSRTVSKEISHVEPEPTPARVPPTIEIPIEPARPIRDLLDDIEGAREGQAEATIVEAVERTVETLAELRKRFPGKLRIDRFSMSGRPLRAAQYGGLLELVVRMGAAATDLVIEKMGASQREARFYATVCTAELRPRAAVPALGERLFDHDFGVRAAALEALTGYPLRDLAVALAKIRRSLLSDDPELVVAATSSIIALGDVDSLPDLMGAIERSARGGDHIRRALIALTGQDFGTSEKKWRKWYEGARQRHRVEWLIEALSHKDDAIRENAINVLRRMTGEYFGYHHDLPRRERDAAAQRWLEWWRDEGRRRFA